MYVPFMSSIPGDLAMASIEKPTNKKHLNAQFCPDSFMICDSLFVTDSRNLSIKNVVEHAISFTSQPIHDS